MDDGVPFDDRALLTVACALWSGLALFATVWIGLSFYVPGDLAALLVHNGLGRRDVVVSFAAAVMLTLLLVVLALAFGRSARRRVLRSRGSLRGRRVAWFGMAAAVVVAVLMVLLLALAADATQSEYADAVRCLQPEACIDP